MATSFLGCDNNFIIRCTSLTKTYVVAYRILKQIDILEYHRDMTHQTFRIYFIHREITKKNTSFLWVIKTGAKFHYCTFSTSGRTDKGSQ